MTACPGGERVLQRVREPPWVCLVPRKGARRDDIAFWAERRGWTTGASKDGRRIYGEGLEEGKAYDVVPSGG